jgi:hypothetical protein
MRAVSSVASMVTKYAQDTIIEDTPCWLHVPFRRKGKTVKIAKAIAMVGRIFDNAPIASDCAKVQVLRVIDDQYLDTKLDYPNEDEVIEKLQDGCEQFHPLEQMRYLSKGVMDQSPPRPETSSSMPETEPQDKEVTPPPIPETLPHDKEAMPLPMPETESQPHDKEVPPPPEPQPHDKEVPRPP